MCGVKTFEGEGVTTTLLLHNNTAAAPPHPHKHSCRGFEFSVGGNMRSLCCSRCLRKNSPEVNQHHADVYVCVCGGGEDEDLLAVRLSHGSLRPPSLSVPLMLLSNALKGSKNKFHYDGEEISVFRIL